MDNISAKRWVYSPQVWFQQVCSIQPFKKIQKSRTINDIEKILILNTDADTICITSQIWNLLNIEFPFL